MANLAVACMALDTTNPDVIYVGTGKVLQRRFHSWRRRFKSTDGGTHGPNYPRPRIFLYYVTVWPSIQTTAK